MAIVGDNGHVEIISNKDNHFDMAIRICFDTEYKKDSKIATHYKIYKKEDKVCEGYGDDKILVIGLALFEGWTNPPEGAIKLPYNMDVEAALSFAKNWLKTAEYPEEPDMDGDCKEGFRIYNGDFWGHIEDSWVGICVIEPHWIMYGK